MALSSPGVEVKVIDESFYTPAEPGTVPLIVVASAENKQNGGGTGIAPGTLKANAGNVYLLTSQKDLADTFGDPVFKTDSNNNPIHAGEQNEYGLQAAYSLLGVSNRAFVVRADIDVNQLNASANAPVGDPTNGTYWFDTANTEFGIFEWNGNVATVTGGQTFTVKEPLVINDTAKLSGNAPKTSIGAIGDYAIVTATTSNELYYKNRSGAWVKVGSNAWTASWPTVAGSTFTSATSTETFTINGTTVTIASSSIDGVVTGISNASISGITAAKVNNKLEIYADGTSGGASMITIGTGSANLSNLGLTAGTYYAPALQISKHTQVPAYKRRDTNPRPTGSVWMKTTEPNNGARWRVKRYNSRTELWESTDAPIYDTTHSALYNLDPAGGGENLSVGTLFVKSNASENSGTDSTPTTVDFTIYRRNSTGANSITSAAITASTFSAGQKAFLISETLKGQESLDTGRTVTFNPTGAVGDSELLASAINGAGFTNIVAEIDAQNRVIISHKLGGDFRLNNGTGSPLTALFSTSTTANYYTAPAGDTAHSHIATLWKTLSYTAGATAPSTLTADGTLWYSSVVDEVDIMVHNGTTWVGYLDSTSPYYAVSSSDRTDPAGPIVAASRPTTQSDGTALKNGDLWIDTSDLENYPTIYKYNADLQKFELVDKTDQSTENGVLFADARAGTSGGTTSTAPTGTIADMLVSNFLDPDAPSPALYPKGMLLWNLRRSGFNVKKFAQNNIDVTKDNIRQNNVSMANYYPHRWVTESANQDDGSGTFGRKAQRKVVVQALQALVNSNQEIRDEESRVFNLIACPGYPELIGELITLNYDRGLTAFVVADTPARLTSDATSLLAWGTNQRLALEDNDLGGVSYDEYMGMFYPWGFTSDNFGNNVVVPPSHMMLRTIALNDQVAYPWFAPAGVRRGGITNATAVGYVDGEGEFKSVALNNGQRDTLYEAKINPITFLTGTGLVNYGQKTRAKAASALDRINVARLVAYLRRQLNSLAKPYIFEPNDKITRDQIKASAEALMLELVGQRALYDYIVVCDESNNTPSRIDRNELWVDIAIEPVKAVEFIYIPLRLKNTGEIKALG